MHVTASEFQKDAGHYQDLALHEPVIITSQDRPDTVLISAAMFKVMAEGRVARRVEQFDEETLRAIASASVPAEYDELDRLLTDWTP